MCSNDSSPRDLRKMNPTSKSNSKSNDCVCYCLMLAFRKLTTDSSPTVLVKSQRVLEVVDVRTKHPQVDRDVVLDPLPSWI